MAEPIVKDPVLQTRYRFSRSTDEDGGEVQHVDMEVDPGGGVTPHIHHHMEERFTVKEGRAEFLAGRKWVAAGPGETVVVPPGTRHAFRNRGDVVARVECEARPPSTLQDFLEDAAALSRAGTFTRHGLPKRPAPAEGRGPRRGLPRDGRARVPAAAADAGAALGHGAAREARPAARVRGAEVRAESASGLGRKDPKWQLAAVDRVSSSRRHAQRRSPSSAGARSARAVLALAGTLWLCHSAFGFTDAHTTDPQSALDYVAITAYSAALLGLLPALLVLRSWGPAPLGRVGAFALVGAGVGAVISAIGNFAEDALGVSALGNGLYLTRRPPPVSRALVLRHRVAASPRARAVDRRWTPRHVACLVHNPK